MTSDTPLPSSPAVPQPRERAVSRRALLASAVGAAGAALLHGAGVARAQGLPAEVPVIDPERYVLLVHGLVDRPVAFTLADLKRLGRGSRTCFRDPAGNPRPTIPGEATPGSVAARPARDDWTGVPLAVLLREAGVRPGASWFSSEGEDGRPPARSIPLEKAWDDALIAYAQNGEPLRPEQGYPARLLLPGWAPCLNTKWIRRIEVSDRPLAGRAEACRAGGTKRHGGHG